MEILSTEFPYYKSIINAQKLFDAAENDQQPEDLCYEEHMNEDNYWTSLFTTEPPEI